MPAGLALSPSVRVWLLGLEQSPSVQLLLVRGQLPLSRLSPASQGCREAWKLLQQLWPACELEQPKPLPKERDRSCASAQPAVDSCLEQPIQDVLYAGLRISICRSHTVALPRS